MKVYIRLCEPSTSSTKGDRDHPGPMHVNEQSPKLIAKQFEDREMANQQTESTASEDVLAFSRNSESAKCLPRFQEPSKLGETDISRHSVIVVFESFVNV